MGTRKMKVEKEGVAQGLTSLVNISKNCFSLGTSLILIELFKKKRLEDEINLENMTYILDTTKAS